METVIRGQKFVLHPHRAAFWVDESALLIADAHFGKSRHFRKNGLAVPSILDQGDFERLRFLLSYFQPEKVLFLGDLFHSHLNADWQKLRDLIFQFKKVIFQLILGNHDILNDEIYHQSGLITCKEYFSNGFLLTHHPKKSAEGYNLAGHIHPGVVLKGNGRQTLRKPCFYFGKNSGLLPAFGNFTGIHPIETYEGDQVFVLLENEIIPKH
jgi:DNA ligase-associated metallophosphoesterase